MVVSLFINQLLKEYRKPNKEELKQRLYKSYGIFLQIFIFTHLVVEGIIILEQIL